MKLILTLAIILFTSPAYGQYPTLKDVQMAVDEIVEKCEKMMEEQDIPIKLREIVWRARRCYLISDFFADYLTDMGFQPYLRYGYAHGFITVEIINPDGKHEEVIIDPTYRQWFQDRRFTSKTRNLEQVFNIFKMPKVLVVEKKKLKETIFGFPIKPIWIWARNDEDKTTFNFEKIYKRNIKLSYSLPKSEKVLKLVQVRHDYFYDPKIKIRLMLAELFN